MFISGEFLSTPEFNRIMKRIPVEKTSLRLEFRIISLCP